MKLLPGCGEFIGKIDALKMSLCGLKKASHEFLKLLTANLLDCGFEQCLTDTCVLRMMDSQDPIK